MAIRFSVIPNLILGILLLVSAQGANISDLASIQTTRDSLTSLEGALPDEPMHPPGAAKPYNIDHTSIPEEKTRQPDAPASIYCVNVTEIPTSECEALVVLYTTTDGDNWTENTDWLVTNTPCSWFGITCESNNVLDLSLPNNNLVGSIPTELGDLSALEQLNLSGNVLSGSLPIELTGITTLWELQLSANQLDGTIPIELGDMPALQHLFLRSNQFDGEIPTELTKLTTLTHLGLGKNQLSGGVPPEFSGMPNLAFLDFSGNQLTGSVPPQYGSAPSLVNLNLSSNLLTGTIPPQLGDMPVVQKLELQDNQITGTIPVELTYPPNLKWLDLSTNQLSGGILPEFGSVSTLQHLILSTNQFTGTIPVELGALVNLLSLDLSSNQLDGTIPPDLGDMASLNTLQINENQLTGSIPPELENLPVLLLLSLAGNQLSGNIPPQIGSLTNLRYLNLGTNQLDGNIPGEIWDLNLLEYLFLHNNALDGEIPAAVTNLVNLVSTNVGYNMLSASNQEAIDYLDQIDPDWADTQTVPPTNLGSGALTSTSIEITWTPINYTWDGGFYEVSYAGAPGGPYTVLGTTADKSASSYNADGLSPNTPYYFLVRTYTPAHGFQQNALWSEYSPEFTETTYDYHTQGILAGWNLVALSLQPGIQLKAQSLLDAINNQGGDCSGVDRWYNSGWDTHADGLPFNDFDVNLGEGYFIKCVQISEWTLEGRPFSASVPLSLVAGWNLVGIPYPTGYTAQSLLDGINSQGGACTEVDRWLNSGWDSHVDGLPFNDFSITTDEGYFVKCTQASSFTP